MFSWRSVNILCSYLQVVKKKHSSLPFCCRSTLWRRRPLITSLRPTTYRETLAQIAGSEIQWMSQSCQRGGTTDPFSVSAKWLPCDLWTRAFLVPDIRHCTAVSSQKHSRLRWRKRTHTQTFLMEEVSYSVGIHWWNISRGSEIADPKWTGAARLI